MWRSVNTKRYSYYTLQCSCVLPEMKQVYCFQSNWQGIKGSVDKEIVMKVNSVMIPTINGDHLFEVAKKTKKLGAFVQKCR